MEPLIDSTTTSVAPASMSGTAMDHP
jgi:hypothetical protein